MPQKPYIDKYSRGVVLDLPPPPPIDKLAQSFGDDISITRAIEADDKSIRKEWGDKGKSKSDVVLRRGSDGRTGMRTLLTVAEDPATAVLDANARVPFDAKLTYQSGYRRVPSNLPEWLGGKSKRVPVLNVDYIRSEKKGAGFKAFQKLADIAEKSGRPIRSDTIVPQYSGKRSELFKARNMLADVNSTMPRGSSTYDLLLKDYPQLRYRDVPKLKTSGKFMAELSTIDPRMAVIEEGVERTGELKFKSLADLRRQVNKIPKEYFTYPNSKMAIYDLETTARPSLARLTAAKNLAKVGSVAGEALGPAMYMFENALNYNNPENIRQFNRELAEMALNGDWGMLAAKGLFSPMTAVSGLSLAAQEAAGYYPMGRPKEEEPLRRRERIVSEEEKQLRTGPQPKFRR